MTLITARLLVAPDGAISTSTQLPVGEHLITVTLAGPPQYLPGKPFSMQDFPLHDEPWDDSISLRREDMYDDEGRLRG